MAKRVNFWELPVEAAQPDDTLVAYRGRGKIARITVDDVQGSGTVTSVGLSMPAGFSVANTPVTSSGTITVTFASGYGLPTTTQMGQWSTAFGWGDHAQAGYALASAVTSALAGKVDTSDSRLTNSREWTASTVGQAEAEAGTATTRRAWTAQRVWQAITAWWNASAAKSKLDGIQAGATANQTDAYLLNRANHTGTQAASTITGLATVATTGSYNDLTGKPSIPAGTVTSVGLSAPTGFSVSGSPVTGSGTLALAFASGYSLPTTAKQGQWDQAYGWGNHASAGYALSSSLAAVATSGSYGDLSGKPALGTAASKDAPSSGNATSTQVVLGNDTRLTDARAPTSHTHAAAQVTGLATVATTGSYNDLSDKPSISSGTVTSVNVNVPTGLQASGGPVTSSGTITISYASGYAIPTTAKQGQWDTAYGWGNHASAGYAAASSLATVATSGSYNDLSNKPSIPTLPSTVSQAEAEGGTSTTVRGWTAQRVRQAIAAWWNTITLTKADVGLSNVDNTADNTKTVHSFIVSDTRSVVSVPNAVPARSGLFEFKNNSSVGSPPEPSTGTYSHVLTINGWTADGTGGWPTQISFGNGLAFRKGTSATTWGPWNLLYHSGNAYSASEVDALISAATSGAWVWQSTTTSLAKNTPNKVDFSSPRTLTLPASPAENDYVAILRTAGTTVGSTIARNGQTIMGAAEDMTLDVNVSYLRLDFVNSSWRIAS